MKVIDKTTDCISSFTGDTSKCIMSNETFNNYIEINNYPNDYEPYKERLDKLKELFNKKFSSEPEIFVRVPGRVNLIGEHVDYCGYSVCPMAIDKDIFIAASKISGNGDFLKVTNEQDQYKDTVIPSHDFSISVDDGWCAYILCGIKGAMNLLGKEQPGRMLMAISGTIPPGSGLSSSSALVCASLLVTTTLNKIKINKYELAEISATCERYIGTEGGGMDQAIAFLATKGCAKHIQFNPIKTVDVKLPEELVFVIAHSLVTKNKAESSEFNTRVIECRLATQILAKQNGLEWKKILKVADLQKALNCSLDQLLDLIINSLHDGYYSKDEICKLLEVSPNELEQISLSPNTRHLTSYLLRPRVTHVVSEAERVNKWLKLTSSNDVCSNELGQLMSQSHESMSRLYEAGHTECDRLVQICLKGPGCLGARITGAGWGGAVVAVTTRKSLDPFLNHVKSNFYENYVGSLDQVLFSSEPQQGAQLFNIK
ncbi:hypothetical protein O3M35_002508 [Rhynocoris fuscipes]|uniref:N-acetylgalactosamine kinase n=1 Tax=Rhynocoris fuscipes TaxID=488301 RepID=A0AAW1CP22_9HEMI